MLKLCFIFYYNILTKHIHRIMYPKIYEFWYFVDKNRYIIIFCNTFDQINYASASHPKYKDNVISDYIVRILKSRCLKIKIGSKSRYKYSIYNNNNMDWCLMH